MCIRDSIHAAMTNITGQVRQNQEKIELLSERDLSSIREEIEIIRNRPTNIASISTTENHEGINVKHYKRKPMEFLARIKEKFAKHRITRWNSSREMLDEYFKEITDTWWMAMRNDLTDYQQFKNRFKAKYWSESTQNIVRDNICHGRYDANRGTTPTTYFLGKVCLARHLEPRIPEPVSYTHLLPETTSSQS